MIMDIQAVLNEYDGFYARNDPEGAYAFICGKIAEARDAGAWQPELTMLNEVIGYSRRKGTLTLPARTRSSRRTAWRTTSRRPRPG